MTQTRTTTITVEYALLVDWEDGNRPEVIAAQDADHAKRMAQTIYAGHPSWTVQREIGPWCYLSQVAPGHVADMSPTPARTATPGCICCGLLAARGAELPCGDCR